METLMANESSSVFVTFPEDFFYLKYALERKNKKETPKILN